MVVAGGDAMEHWTKHSKQCLGNGWPYNTLCWTIIYGVTTPPLYEGTLILFHAAAGNVSPPNQKPTMVRCAEQLLSETVTLSLPRSTLAAHTPVDQGLHSCPQLQLSEIP